MNNCLEVAEPEITGRCPDSEAQEPQVKLADRFQAALAQCKVEAECLDNKLWEELDCREKVARLLAAMGFRSKAARFHDCHATAIPVDCVACGAQWFSHYQCTLRYCEHCGPWHFRRLMEKYREPVSQFVAEQPSQRGRTLAMLDFTVRAYNAMPECDEPRRLNKLIRRWFQRMMPKGAKWGAIFAVETGHELDVKHPGRTAGGWNLHVHVLYYGPYLNQAEGLRLWIKLLGDSGGFRVRQCPDWRKNLGRAVRRALVHHFGYIMKPAAVSGERVAALEVLFSGTRRVHALGCFYRLPKVQKVIASPRCPKCGESLPINLRAWHKSERHPVCVLRAEGRRDMVEVRREAGRARIFRDQSP